MRLAMRAIALCAATLLAACAHTERRNPMSEFLSSEIRVTEHRGADDLLSGGLGYAGLANPVAPMPADGAAPTPEELRRRALHANWRAIVDLVPTGGFGTIYGGVPSVPGREYQAFAKVPGAKHSHRLLAQLPDGFDKAKRCLVVTPVSGSRGAYGSIGVAGAWALPRGCAIVYTDKGAGTGLFDVASGTGVALDGTRAEPGAQPLEFAPEGAVAPGQAVLYKHAHSGDNPEADWGRHVIQAARFGLHALSLAFPELAPFTPENTRLIAFGISNGGGAVLRAAELPEAAWFEAMIAGEPNVTVAGVRPLYDVSTEAALFQPCILLDPRIADAAWPVPPGALSVPAALRCASLASAGMLGAGTPVQQAAEAYERLRASGWDEGALALSPTNVMFDLWRAVGATYAAAYARTGTGPMPCGYAFGAVDPAGKARATLASERALWWSDSAGVAPSAGVMIVDGKAAAPDPALPGLQCLRALWQGDDATARAVKAGVEAVRGSGVVKSKRVAVVHGSDDGLVPAAFTSRPWSLSAHAQNPRADIRYYEVEHAQHFDAFLGLPAYGARYVPLIPYLWRLLDLTLEKAPLPPEGKVATRPRGAGTGGVPPALTKDNLGDWFR